jgi:outer membrane biosynthesis protein TonB
MVRIYVRVDKDGVPQKLRVISAAPELVEASLDALKQWRFKPYKLGKAVPFETSVDINYIIPRDKPVYKLPKH